MKIFPGPRWAGAAAAILLLAASGFASEKSNHYVFTNNDPSGKLSNSSNFYAVGTKGLLTQKATVTTGYGGVGGGYFGLDKLAALNNGKQQCVFVSDSF